MSHTSSVLYGGYRQNFNKSVILVFHIGRERAAVGFRFGYRVVRSVEFVLNVDFRGV